MLPTTLCAKAPGVLQPFLANLKKIHRNWRARAMIQNVPKNQHAQIRLKIVAQVRYRVDVLRDRTVSVELCPRA